jgi:hypothetical protein
VLVREDAVDVPIRLGSQAKEALPRLEMILRKEPSPVDTGLGATGSSVAEAAAAVS